MLAAVTLVPDAVLAALPGQQAEQVAAARLQAGDCAGAASAYRAAVEAFGTSARHLGLGRALLCADRPEAAYAHLRLAYEARGSNEVESLMALVDACLRLGREQEAAGLLDQFGTHPRPEHQRFAQQRRAALLRRIGDRDGALAAIRGADGPFTVWDHRTLCVLGLERGQPRRALPHCHAAAKRGAMGWEWTARALAALDNPALAARVMRARAPDAAPRRWSARVAARYLQDSGNRAGAVAALDEFAAAGGQAPGLEADRARVGAATDFAYRAAGRSGASDGLRYSGWDHTLALSSDVPLVGGLVLQPGGALLQLSERVEQPAPRLDFDRERRRADLDLGLMRRWPCLGLGLAARAGVSVLDRQRAIPRAGIRIGAAPTGARWARLGLEFDYGPAEHASGVSLAIHRLRARLDVRLHLAPLELRASAEHRHFALEGRTPREMRLRGGVGWPLVLGPLVLAPGVGLTLDRAWYEPAGGVPLDLTGDRLGLWLLARLELLSREPVALRLGLGWAPGSQGYRGAGWSRAGDGPWRAELAVDLRTTAWAELSLAAEYTDELDRRRLGLLARVRFRP